MRILGDIKRFAGTEPEFIPFPATYLDQRRWMDEPDAEAKRIDGALPQPQFTDIHNRWKRESEAV